MTIKNKYDTINLTMKLTMKLTKGICKMNSTQRRTKVALVNNMDKKVLVEAKSERIEMKLNTENALASGLLIQRLTELYENPIEAAVRETVSNAIDAVMRETSGDRPTVRIYTPTNLNPVLKIKDNGVGMTYEDLKEIYSRYGASTKTDDLDQIGAYGLGAKSPLAYGNEFTVSSVKDGEKTKIIVAKEELTNYIRIIESGATDEPSGTTVSIPVDSNDIEEFAQQINNYKEIPMDKDLDLYINGKLVENKEFVLINDDVLIYDGAEKVYSRMWVKVEEITSLLYNMTAKEAAENINYVIGGWKYLTPSSRKSSYRRKSNGLVLELKAGIVGFNSSRDAILHNERYEVLENLVIDYVKSDSFFNQIVKVVNELNLDDFKKVLTRLLSGRRSSLFIENKKMSVKKVSSYSYSQTNSHIARNFNVGSFVHKETGYNFNDFLKNVPEQKNKEKTIVLRESKSSYNKAVSSELMYSELAYRTFEYSAVKDINDYMKDVFIEDKEDGHSLEVLMANLAIMVGETEERENSTLTFVTDVKDEKHVTKLRTGRKAIVRMVNKDNVIKNKLQYKSILVYTEFTENQIKNMIKNLDFGDMEVNVFEIETLLEKLKEHRAKNTSYTKREQKNLETSLYKYDLENNRYIYSLKESSDVIKEMDEEKEIFIIVSRDQYPAHKMAFIKNWICNDKELDESEFELYLSYGMHTAVDVEVIKGITENVLSSPMTEPAGRSKVYLETIYPNKAQSHPIKHSNDKASTSKLAFARMLCRMVNGNGEKVAQSIRLHLAREAEKISQLAKEKSINVPTKFLKGIEEFSKENFPEMKYTTYSDLYSGEMGYLYELLDEDQKELLTNVSITFFDKVLIKQADNVYKFTTEFRTLLPNGGYLTAIEEAYKGKETAYSKMIKAQINSYLEFMKELLEEMDKVEF